MSETGRDGGWSALRIGMRAASNSLESHLAAINADATMFKVSMIMSAVMIGDNLMLPLQLQATIESLRIPDNTSIYNEIRASIQPPKSLFPTQPPNTGPRPSRPKSRTHFQSAVTQLCHPVCFPLGGFSSASTSARPVYMSTSSGACAHGSLFA